MIYYNKYREYKNIDSTSGRVYDIPPGLYPSVTTMLSATANAGYLDAWRERIGIEEANRITKEAAERGTLVHQYLEDFCTDFPKATKIAAKHFIENSKLSTEKPHIIKMVNHLIGYLATNEYESVAQEFVVWDTELKIAGRCDNIGYINGVLTLVDFKTARKEKSGSNIKDYFIQATAYCKAHNQMFDANIAKFRILIANEEGTFQVFERNHIHYVGELKYRVKKFYEKHH